MLSSQSVNKFHAVLGIYFLKRIQSCLNNYMRYFQYSVDRIGLKMVHSFQVI
jgi:hypothetical protein